jgi:DNA helicase-2/ATP-dependent DNA helicase PcrA
VFHRYEALLADQNAVDFDDLLVRTAILLRDVAEVRETLEERFQYTLIDEYQDTNHAQYLIAKGLTSRRRNLCATGDPDQSIYGWRGADIENILEFERDYPDATVVRLEQNFRSTKRILSAADRVIGHNHRRKKKSLWTENDDGAAVRVWHCADEHDEARRIAEDISAYVGGGGSAGDAAIFYRVTSLTRVLEEALRREGLPYQIARGTEFYNRKEIKDVLAYVRVLVNPADEPACVRAINTPARGIGKTSVQRLIDHARQNHIALRAALDQAERIESIKSAKTRVKLFADMLTELGKLPPRPVKSFLETVLSRSGLEAELKNDPDPEKPALANVGELISAAAEYDGENPEGEVGEWLAQVCLVNDTDRVDLQGGAVTMMTLHAAKGLEFPLVYVAGLEDMLLPHARAFERDGELEEERRLFFVGMTRARQKLTLTRANYRMMRGFSERRVASTFLGELPEDELVCQDFTRDAADADDHVDEEPLDFDPSQWTRGRLVRHPDYGMGRITFVEYGGRRPWVRVKFNAYGEKTFSLQHAELEVVEV